MWRLVRRFVLECWVFAFGLAATTIPATSYESQLDALARALVSQLEAAGQINGTVLDFVDLQGQPNELGRFFAQELSDKLVTLSKSVSFLDRAGLDYLLQENRLSAEGLVNPETTRKLGNLIGIDTLVVGSLTPIGESFRLSVRAIAVETGKIVAVESVNVAASRDLQAMYSHGVSPERNLANQKGEGSKQSVRDQFRRDSIKLEVDEVVVHGLFGDSSSGYAVATFSIENLSGVGIDAALADGRNSLGPCSGSSRSTGLDLWIDGFFGGSYQPKFKYIAPGSQVFVTLQLDDCAPSNFSGSDVTSLVLSLIVIAEGERIDIPLSAGRIPVRVVFD